MLSVFSFCARLDEFLAFPALVLCFGVGIFLSIKTRFIQFRAFPRFIHLITHGVKGHHSKSEKEVNPLQALFASMATTIGMGNIVGPSVAIISGGPGALFWLAIYPVIGSVIKFAEVSFAVSMRTKLPNGNILGGPTQYLKRASWYLAKWYGILTLILFAGWSGQQANTLANVFACESVPHWVTGSVVAILLFIVLKGGIARIGALASKLVPLMFVLYVGFTGTILLSNPSVLVDAIRLVFAHACNPCAALGGFVGASVFAAMRFGVHRSIYITESGLGTSSIAHAMSDVDKPQDQAILAMFSVIADTILSILSGLLILVSGAWVKGEFSNVLVYEVFKSYSPGLGKWVLLVSITLFVVTTIIGNSFNASQSFASFTGYRGMIPYYVFLSVIVFWGALAQVSLVWKMMDVVQVLVAIPHLLGLLFLSITYGYLLDDRPTVKR